MYRNESQNDPAIMLNNSFTFRIHNLTKNIEHFALTILNCYLYLNYLIYLQ